MTRTKRHRTVKINRDIYKNGKRYYEYVYADGTQRLYLAKGKNQSVPEEFKVYIPKEITVADLPANMPKLHNLDDAIIFAKIFDYVEY